MEENVYTKLVGSFSEKLGNDKSADDYLNADGLLMCGICHTPKQTKITVLGQERTVFCVCKCKQEAQQQEEEAQKRKEAKERIEAMRKKGLSESQYLNCTFDLDDGADQAASQTCRNYVKEWEQIKDMNAGLLLLGDVGGGKTFLASCIANALIDQGVAVMMTTIPRLTAAMSKDFGSERINVLNKISDAPLLILDDVGTERNTTYGNELMYEIINTRYKAQRPLIITTNLTMTALKNPEDITYKRIYDRITEMCTPVKVSTGGRRQQIANIKINKLKTVLDI